MKQEITLPFPSPEFKEVWVEFETHRKEKKVKPYTPTGLKNCFKNLVFMADNDEQKAIAIIRQTLTNNWTGLYQLKNLMNGQQSINAGGGSQATGTVAEALAGY